MDYSQSWAYPLPEATYNPASSASVSSYFARPNKVVKSSSRNSSPRTLGRRKTTTAATISSRTRSAVDHLRCSAQHWQNSADFSRSRPVSWHPNSVNALNIPFNPSINGQDLSAWDFSTAEVNGLITPVSFPAASEPQIQELITPLDELPSHDMTFAYENQQYDTQIWSSQNQPKADLYSFNMFYQASSMQSLWQFNQPALPANVQTAPSSPDCLPVQNIGLDTLCIDKLDANAKEDQEDLVGMGLYDSPAEIQSSSLLFGNISNNGRKALKLEESFEPVEQEEEEEEGGDDAEEQVDDYDDKASDEVSHVANSSEPLATPLAFETAHETESLASRYLATLRQLNSAYYPAGHGYSNWI